MFDIGWQEIFIIGVLAIIVVGPKDLPRVMRTVVAWVRKARGVMRDFQSGIDDIVNEAGLEDIRADAERAASHNFKDVIEKAIDPDNEMARGLDFDDSEKESDAKAPKNSQKPKKSKDVSKGGAPQDGTKTD